MDRAQTLLWYCIRDQMLGMNGVKRDVESALACLGRGCSHPDAILLRSALGDQDVERLIELAVDDDENDHDLQDHDENEDQDAPRRPPPLEQATTSTSRRQRALLKCLASFFVHDSVLAEELLLASAEAGCALAQAELAAEAEEVAARFELAQKSAAQMEREGLGQLALCFQHGWGCEDVETRMKEELAKRTHLAAAELGRVESMVSFAMMLSGNTDKRHWIWLGKASALGDSYAFVRGFAEQVARYKRGLVPGPIMLEIGRALKGHVRPEKRTIFGQVQDHRLFGPAQVAINFFDHQYLAYKEAVTMWTFVGIRLKVVKDIRKMIGEMIWRGRDEAEY